MDDAVKLKYIASLPEVDTARLPQGAFFYANGHIYHVTETGAGGFHKARVWRKTEKTDVALIPNSFPSRFLPLVERGRMLPVYRSRQELTEHDQLVCYVFPTEALALEAATLDAALVQSGGAYVRAHGEEPAFTVTDGVRNFRLYYYRQSAAGRKTKLTRLEQRPLPFGLKNHTEGPGYWRLLPHWIDQLPDVDVTQPIDPHAVLRALADETLTQVPPPHNEDDDEQ